MLKEYKEKDINKNNFKKINFTNGDISARYRINFHSHGLHYYWSNKKIIQYKGYFNKGSQYSHWIEYEKVLNYYL